MNPPKYENGCVNEYLRKVNEYKINLNKEKYNKILEFINKILKLNGEIKFKSLLKFRNINEKILFKDSEYLVKLFKNDYKDLCNYFNLKNYNIDLIINEENNQLNKDRIIFLINSILNKINYRMLYTIKHNKKYYYIKN
jgi:hypothetical protein